MSFPTKLITAVTSTTLGIAGGAAGAQQPVGGGGITAQHIPGPPEAPARLPFFAVHNTGSQLTVEIPRRALNVDFLVNASAVDRLSGGNLTKDVPVTVLGGPLHWTRQGDSLILYRATGWVHRQLQYARQDAYPILHVAADGTLQIDGAKVFGLVPEAPAFVDTLRYKDPKPLSWTVQQVVTVVQPAGYTTVELSAQAEGIRSHALKSQWRFDPLPAAPPMLPRLRDPRLGYVGPEGLHIAGGQERYVLRWRLEKQNPAAPVSDVVRPIVYRIDSTVPRRWVPYIKHGIEAWNPVFESIGFRHAIVVHDVGPRLTLADGTDAPECLITWSRFVNGVTNGGQTTFEALDGRSNEIRHCTIELGDGTLAFMQHASFVYAGATGLHPHYPFPDSLSGRLLQLVLEHETGHSLGLEHNHKAGSTYPTDSLRSAAFVHRMGTTPSVMSYVHFDAVAQPEDAIAPNDLIARIGPYDRFALAWAYRPIPEAQTPEDEQPTLEHWRAAQDTAPYLRTSVPEFAERIDPGDRLTDDAKYVLGDDPVESAGYILRNLARITLTVDQQRDGTDTPALVAVLRNDVVGFWQRVLAAAIDVVGGATPQSPYARVLARTRTAPIDSARQVEALRFALAHVFYGRDTLVATLFKRTAADTGLMLFRTAESPVGTDAWRAAQQTLARRLLERIGLVVAQTAKTHVLPVACTELERLNNDLARAVTGAGSSDASQAEALQAILQPQLGPAGGICHSTGGADTLR